MTSHINANESSERAVWEIREKIAFCRLLGAHATEKGKRATYQSEK